MFRSVPILIAIVLFVFGTGCMAGTAPEHQGKKPDPEGADRLTAYGTGGVTIPADEDTGANDTTTGGGTDAGGGGATDPGLTFDFFGFKSGD